MQTQIKIPVITRCGPAINMTKDGAYIKNHKGTITWTYDGKAVTGKGIFIAACARSGTAYMTEVLKSLGYEIGHEQTEKDGSVGYHLAVMKPKNCFHQVRHPLKQISSMFDHQSWGFMNQVIETHGRGLLGCMQYWFAWNELLESFCVWHYRLEDLPVIWPEFLNRIDHKYEPLPKVSTDTNSREMSLSCTDMDFSDFADFKWLDLYKCNAVLAQKIEDKALKYGYLLPTPGQSESTETQVACKV